MKDYEKFVYQGEELHDFRKRDALLDDVEKLSAKVNELEVTNNRLFIENQAMTTDLKMMNEQLDRFVDVMLHD